MKKIEVIIEPQYGKWVYYPVCDDAKAFAAIAGTKTLTEPTLVQIKKLGYEIKASAKSLEALTQSLTHP
jgi:hypothetical protein